ncbi:hypothetical protein MMC27_001919 [Xylographa pallens]|nr:hypothetical protein [Xylographa pallens]
MSPLGYPGPIIPTDAGLNPARLTLQPLPPIPSCEPPHNPTDPNRPPTPPPPQHILSAPFPFPPLPTTRAPLRVTFSCTHTAPPSALPPLYTQPQPSSSPNPFSSPPPTPPSTLPYPCRECALTLVQTAQNEVHRALDPGIAALEAQIADARHEIWVGGGGVVGMPDPVLRAYERAHERLRVLLRERVGALWAGRRAWEGVWGAWVGEGGGGGEWA